MIKPHLTYPIGSSWHIRPPQSASTYLGSLQRSALPLTIAVLLLPFPFQPFASRWVFFVFLFFFFLLLPQSSGCFGGIPAAYSAQWRPVGLSPVHHRVSFVLRNSYSVPLIKWIFFASGVCNNRLLPERVTSPTPNLEDQGTTVSLVSILVRPVWHGWPYQESKTPADIALWVNETRKPLFYGKVEVPKWPLRGKFFFFRTANSINLFFKQMYEDQTKEFQNIGA